MKPQFKPEEIYIDLSKLSEDKRKEVRRLLFKKPHYEKLFFLPDYEDKPFLICLYGKWDLEVNKRREYTELTYSQFLDMMGESEEDFAIYKRTFNKIPYPRVEWECNCGFKHCLNEGFEQDYRKDNFKEIRLPTGKCLKCKKEIRTQSLEIKEVLQVENKISIKEIRDIVAKNRGYDNWEILNGSDLYDSDIDEVAKKYAEYKTAQLQADKAELLESLENLTEYGSTGEDAVEMKREIESLIQKHKQ